MSYTNSRNPHHDYKSKASYLITISKRKGVAPFSILMGGKEFPAPYPGVKYTSIGTAIRDQLQCIPTDFPGARILQYVIMPDHVHFVLTILEPIDFHIGKIINIFKTAVGKRVGQLGIFEDGYHDRIKLRYEQLRYMIDYVKDNPRRLLLKREHSDFFFRSGMVELWGKHYICYGNPFLASDPSICAVRVSSKYSSEELERLNKEWKETIRVGGVLVSPFVSPSEKEVLKQAIAGGGKLILITRQEIGERFKPAGRLFDLCAEGRLLIISSQREAVEPRLSRAEAMEMNELASRVASGRELASALSHRPAQKEKRPSCFLVGPRASARRSVEARKLEACPSFS